MNEETHSSIVLESGLSEGGSAYPLLDFIQESQTVDKFNGGGRHKLQLELSILKLCNQAIDLLASLHREDIVDHLQNKNKKGIIQIQATV